VILADHRRAIDVGRVNGKHFLNVAGIGLSVEVARTLDAETKQRLGPLGYPLAVLKTLRNRRSFRARVLCDGREIGLRSVQISVGNGRYYGGGLTVAPDAAIDDGWLDLFSIAPASPLRLLMLGPALKRGSHGERNEVQLFRGRRIEIETSRPMAVNTDGEVTTRTPARFDVRPGALHVLAADPASADAADTNRSTSATAH
jgi:YegS/Rv2252/BmrU family lipid kinase